MKLSILIPTISRRKQLFDNLLFSLNEQIETGLNGVEILHDGNDFDSIGEKRNRLLNMAHGDYVCFVDDDDSVCENYIALLLQGIATNPDCIALKGIITEDGQDPQYFEHSIFYKRYETTNRTYPTGTKYLRYPNHLNCIRSSIAKQFKFPETNHGEDTDWATQIHNSGLLMHEYNTEKVLYFYNYKRNK